MNQENVSRIKNPVFIATVVGIVIATPLLVYGSYRSANVNKIFPNTLVGNVNVGGLSRDVAREKLTSRVTVLKEEGLVVLTPLGPKEISLVNGALSVDIEESVNLAWSRGRKSNFFTNAFEATGALAVRKNYDAVVQLNEQTLQGSISELAVMLNDPPRDVRLDIVGTNVEILTDTKPGRIIDEKGLRQLALARLRNLDTAPIAAEFTSVTPHIDPATAPLATTIARRILLSPLTLLDGGRVFTVTPRIIGTWIVSGSEGNQLIPVIDRTAVSQYVATIATQVNQPPRNLGVRVEGEKVVDFIQPQPGRVIEEDKIIDTILATLDARAKGTTEGTEEALALPIIVKEATTEGDANTLGIQELIGRATTPFTGSPRNRVANIVNGAKFLTGLLVKPGEEFSTIAALGTIDNTTGYLPELVIKGNRTVPEFGGGLCQVSTTLFRAVLNAGLPVTARQNHSYRVSYYEKDGDGKTIGPGLDATIYQPNPDFRFRNDTSNSILISGYVVGDRLTFELYGTKDGRVASVDGPHLLASTPSGAPIYLETDTLKPGEQRQVEKAHPGGTAIATYNVAYADGTRKEQVFKSTYRSWPAQYLVGAESKPEPETEPLVSTGPDLTPVPPEVN